MYKVITAIVGIVVIECVAMMNGINGTVMSLSIAAIAGLGGFELQKVLPKIK